MEDDKSPDLENAVRWDGHSRPHYEAWYAALGQLNSGTGFWIRYAILAPRKGPPTGQVWFVSSAPSISKANVAAEVKFPIDQFVSTKESLALRIGPCSLEAGRMSGSLNAGDVSVTWDLDYESVTDPLEFLPEVLYKASRTRSRLVIPHPFLLIGGKIQIHDCQFVLNGDPGLQGHVWGTRFADEWIWFHCCSFAETEGNLVPAYVTGITAQQRILGRLHLRPLSCGHLVWHERHLPIQPALRWPARWQGPWEWQGNLADEDISVTLSVPWQDMVLAEYEDPAGHRLFCHHTDRADCTVTFRTPRQPARSFHSAGMTHLEIGSRDIDPRVTRKALKYYA